MKCIRAVVRVIAPTALILIGVGASLSTRAQNVLAGYDLFQTQAGTTFMGAPLEGVPLNFYNFGGTIGEQYVGNTDTIIQRMTAAPSTIGGTATIPLMMDSLNLETVGQTTFGGALPLNTYFISLQSSQPAGGTPSVGTMAITYGTATSGTFTSSLDVFFDISAGSSNGPVVYQSDLVLTNSGDSWSDIAPPGAILINGVNNLLNGTDITQDFWPGVPLTESHPSGAQHIVSYGMPDGVPEPGSLALLSGVGLFGLCLARRRAAR